MKTKAAHHWPKTDAKRREVPEGKNAERQEVDIPAIVVVRMYVMARRA